MSYQWSARQGNESRSHLVACLSKPSRKQAILQPTRALTASVTQKQTSIVYIFFIRVRLADLAIVNLNKNKAEQLPNRYRVEIFQSLQKVKRGTVRKRSIRLTTLFYIPKPVFVKHDTIENIRKNYRFWSLEFLGSDDPIAQTTQSAISATILFFLRNLLPHVTTGS